MDEPFYIISEKNTKFGKIIEIGVDTSFDLQEHNNRMRRTVDQAKEDLARKDEKENARED
ncbi:hypothetical protein ACRW9N_12115 [Listeria aquatica]|uniref:hypothetical protein n=1 Tax=Listeria aquatica TaxID=1494960 RepID=UPI003EF53A3D